MYSWDILFSGDPLMGIQEKLSLLSGRGVVPAIARGTIWGFIPTKKLLGWIEVKDKGDHWFVFWTREGNTHDFSPDSNCCLAADFRKDTGEPYHGAPDWTGAWRQELKLCPILKREQREADEIFELIRARIDTAFLELS